MKEYSLSLHTLLDTVFFFFFLEIISNLQKFTWIRTIQRTPILFTQIHTLLTFYPICLYLLSPSPSVFYIILPIVLNCIPRDLLSQCHFTPKFFTAYFLKRRILSFVTTVHSSTSVNLSLTQYLYSRDCPYSIVSIMFFIVFLPPI